MSKKCWPRFRVRNSTFIINLDDLTVLPYTTLVSNGPAQVRGVATLQGSPRIARRLCLTRSCNISAYNEMSTHQNYLVTGFFGRNHITHRDPLLGLIELKVL
jgi:hypothetical protein